MEISWTFWCVDKNSWCEFHISATKNHERKGFTYFRCHVIWCHVYVIWKLVEMMEILLSVNANEYPPTWMRSSSEGNMASCQVNHESLPPNKRGKNSVGSPDWQFGCLARLYNIMKQNSRRASHKPIGFKGRLPSFRALNHWFLMVFFKTWSKTAKAISALVCFATWSLEV